MPLSLSELEDCQCEAMADDVEIDYHRMTNWTREQVMAYFESGGTQEPALETAETLAARRAFPPLAPRKAASPVREWGEFDRMQGLTKPGDTYGFDFPFSAAMLTDETTFGSVWLTRAFRAFGSIKREDEVEIVSVDEFVGGGAASKALLTVRYSGSESNDDLHTELFVKMPHTQVRPLHSPNMPHSPNTPPPAPPLSPLRIASAKSISARASIVPTSLRSSSRRATPLACPHTRHGRTLPIEATRRPTLSSSPSGWRTRARWSTRVACRRPCLPLPSNAHTPSSTTTIWAHRPPSTIVCS